MRIFSPEFENNQKIPARYTCDGENFNPPLGIEDIPESAKSLALIMHDPDASAGDWTHWMIWNIDPKFQDIDENSVPPGAVAGMNESGSMGYEGPCPPSGMHRYTFTLYALDQQLDLDPNLVDRDDLEEAMQGRILDKAVLVGMYGRE